jgi:4-hydroxy-tetrahydrodipicolinate synthase
VQATKAGFQLMGASMGPPRPPRLPLPASQHAALRADLERLGLIGSLIRLGTQ